MSRETRTSRAPVWLDGLDWNWHGEGSAAAEILPPPWVPAFPPRAQPAQPAPAPISPARARRRLLWALAGALALMCLILAAGGQAGVERFVGLRSADVEAAGGVRYSPAEAAALPALRMISTDSAGSSIGVVHFNSAALHGHGTFLVYLPPNMRASAAHYPVIYLLHGNDQLPSAFLQIGIQETLDRLIASHAIPPMIAVMIQGGRGANNWRNYGHAHYETYVLETQELVDRMLPTVAERGGRAIAGLSMGGYGAMALALDHITHFSVVESWLGFFNGLEPQLMADRPVIESQGLHAFIYGAASDTIADPSQDPDFAEQLSAAGAQAQGYIYPGAHNLETIQAHLADMLTYAGQELGQPGPRPASAGLH